MRVKVNKGGIIFITLTVFLGVAAANTGNNLLYMLVSSLLSIMLVSGLISILNLRNVVIKVKAPGEVFANREAVFKVFVASRLNMPSFLIRISSGRDSVIFPVVDRKSRCGEIYMSFRKRGVVKKIRVELSSNFPIGMFQRSQLVDVLVDVVVFPEPVEHSLLPANGGENQGSSVMETVKKEVSGEYMGAREYWQDPLKLVHWKLTAKLERLYVKEYSKEGGLPVVLTLDSVKGDVEERLSKLTFLVLKLLENGYKVGLRIKDKEIPPDTGREHKVRLLSELAFY